MIPVWTLIRVLVPNFGTPFIYMKLVELGRPNRAGGYEQEFKPCALFFLRGGWRTVPQVKFFQSSGIVRNESS